jgi:DNA-binding IclR family transcriptional regulator
MGPGRWDAAALARELECSQRTVHRILQTLSLASVPWFFDETIKAYRVRPGFKFPELGAVSDSPCGPPPHDRDQLKKIAQRLLTDSERLVESMRSLCSLLETEASSSRTAHRRVTE